MYGRNDEYAEFLLRGKDIKIQDANHILLKENLGMMVTFADRKEFGQGADLLNDHVRWELDYWREHASEVESKPRNDLSGSRKDIKVTEIRVSNQKGVQIASYLIGLASKDGVFVLSFSPVDKSVDPIVTEIIKSFKLVNRKLDAEEIKRVSSGINGRQ